MYTILENARIVISLLKKHNIRHIVLSPGGSNIPIVQGVQQDSFFKCYSVVDERSAMYFAIGLYLQIGEPIATSCTSAQATRNYVPGLTEAFYKRVPILAITMSKHPRYLLQDFMQCPIQTSLPIDAVKATFSLPIIHSHHEREQCIRTVNEAILELTHNGNGPVQLDIQELDNETWQFDKNAKLPDVRSIKRYSSSDLRPVKFADKKILIVIGEHRPFDNNQLEMIERFSENNNVVVYSDLISNYHGKFALNANVCIMNMTQKVFDNEYAPDILITLGGVTGDYGIFGLLQGSSIQEHWRVDFDGRVVDTYSKLTRIYQMHPTDFFAKISEGSCNSHTYFEKWEKMMKEAIFDIQIPFSNLYAAQQLHKVIPEYSTMHFAILNSLRVWSNFQIDSSIICYSNVAAFGIDGCLSTMVGTSVENDHLTFLITGDLSFYYDMNALGIRHIKENIRILLVNNNGGAEFKMGNLESKTDVSSFISAANHFKNAKGWCGTVGFKYLEATNKEEFCKQIGTFVGNSEKPILFEIFTNSIDERIANGKMREANFRGDATERIQNQFKASLKELVGVKTIDKIKKTLS